MNETAKLQLFENLKPELTSFCYRMLGSIDEQTMLFRKHLFVFGKVGIHSGRIPHSKHGFIVLHQTYAWTS
ncbi:hypothetical protein [Metabacillus sp. RGM 3146]|uniref:hypothetical protein n=1 Tax=Metabacillus sp. RGM 3146 TaxID=3401092 RepID=UPI003B9A45A1